MAQLPWRKPVANASTPAPRALTLPAPVMTTLVRIKELPC
jgi:hypothetical protein